MPLAMEMSFKGFSIFSFGEHFIQQSTNIFAILVKGDEGNISVKYHIEIKPLAKEEMFTEFSIFSSGGHFVQPSRIFFSNFGTGQ